MTKEEIRDIFIQEASEIIDALDVNIIKFEKNPEDKEILYELFRGVHTLKGSANSFGFTGLGEFVHHFEDLLDYFRNTGDTPSSEHIDMFLDAVDIIKEVLAREIKGDKTLPENYDETLQNIKKMIQNDTIPTPEQDASLGDLASEFGNENESTVSQTATSEDQKSLYPLGKEELETIEKQIEAGEKLYSVKLTLDDDIYFRGFDHAKIFKLLSDHGSILDSWWDMSGVDTLETMDPERSHIKSIHLFYLSKEPEEKLKELFEYIEDNEYTLEQRSIKDLTPDATFVAKQKNSSQPTVNQTKPKSQDQKNQASDIHNPVKNTYIRIATNKLDELFNSVGELVIAQNFIAESAYIQSIKNENFNKTMKHLSKITRLIQDRVMSLRMIPIQETFEKMNRVVRDISKELNKEVLLKIEGADTEIDKTMVDSLSAPLMHLIRNAIDHGLEETSQDRVKANKNSTGIITLRASHRGGNIAIEVRDDGRGINRDKVFSKAVERGLVNKDDILSEAQINALIMQGGFSTADVVTEVSGRGVGLDVVKNAIKQLHGKIEIKSEAGKGSTFTVMLPLTLAIIDGMIVKSANNTFIIPTLSVIESFIPTKKAIHSVKHKSEFIDVRGEMLPIVRLNRRLNISEDMRDIWESVLVCIEDENGKYGLLVDELVERKQVVIKTLGSALSKIKEIAGGAIMGNGEIALILNVQELHAARMEAE